MLFLTNLFETLGYYTIGIISRLRTPPLPQPEAVKKILVMRLDHLGDVIMTTPFLQALRGKFPHAEITVLLAPWSKEIPLDVSLVDRKIFYDPFWRSAGGKPGDFFSIAGKLRKENFDITFNARPESKWEALLSYLIGAPHRVGSGLEVGTFFYNHYILPGDWETEHLAESTLKMLRETYGDFPPVSLRFPISEETRKSVDDLFEREGIKIPPPVVCIHPGVRVDLRNWDNQKFAGLADALPELYDCQVLLVGGPDDVENVRKIEDLTGTKPRSLAGMLSIQQLGEVIRRSGLFIGLESMAGHVAAAVGTPAVIIFSGINPPGRFSPYTDNKLIIQNEVPCSPCRASCDDRRCITGIQVKDVLEKIKQWKKLDGKSA